MLNATQISDDVFFTLPKAEQIEAARMLRLQRISANCAIDPQRLADWHERQAAGVEFIAENGGGAGVRLRKAAP